MSVANNGDDFLLSQLKYYREARVSYTFWITAKKIWSWLLYSKTFPLIPPDPLPH